MSSFKTKLKEPREMSLSRVEYCSEHLILINFLKRSACEPTAVGRAAKERGIASVLYPVCVVRSTDHTSAGNYTAPLNDTQPSQC